MFEFERVENVWLMFIEVICGSFLFVFLSGNGVDIFYFCGFKDVVNFLFVYEKLYV